MSIVDASMPLHILSDAITFPPPAKALENGLLAVGGDLSRERLLAAYSQGIFPWYNEGDPILWWSPDPRLVLFPHELHISRSLSKIIRQERFNVTLDADFAAVIRSCATAGQRDENGTWITSAMEKAYIRLHIAGHAHSVEVRQAGQLVGGLYGVAIGRCFFGESMFARVSNASKVALAHLVHWLAAQDFTLIDCQVTTPHLKRLGAREIARDQFIKLIKPAVAAPSLPPEAWQAHRPEPFDRPAPPRRTPQAPSA